MYKENTKAMTKLNNKGVSLIEIVLAITLMGIITVAFFPVFGLLHSQIFSMGEKNKAMSELQGKIDALYTISEINAMKVWNKLGGPDYSRPDNVWTTKYNGKDYNFSYINTNITGPGITITGSSITVVYFYKKDSRYVSLSTFIKGGP